MESFNRIFVVFFLVTSPIGSASAGWFGPSNYEECILDKMKGAKNTYAAAAIADACRKKYPGKKQAVTQAVTKVKRYQSLPTDAIGLIQLVCNERKFDAFFRASSRQMDGDTSPKSIAHYIQLYEDMERPAAIKCSLHNGSNKWTVTSITFRVTDFNSGKYFDDSVFLGGMGYEGVSPLQNVRDEAVNINSSIVTGKFRLSIISAVGFIE